MDKYVKRPSFKRFVIFHDELVGVENEKVDVKLDNPVFVGQAILDLSKLLMYRFHYDVMKETYGENIKLLFTDTDSLCYEIQTDDVYKDLHDLREHFDFSNYPETHPLHSTQFKKVPGKMKDELGGTFNECTILKVNTYNIFIRQI